MNDLKNNAPFDPVFIKATNLNDVYFSLLWNLWHHGRKYKIDSGSFAGSHRLEFDFCSGFVTHPHERPLAPIMPPGISPITTDDEINKYFANYLMDPNLGPNEHYRYSSWINSTEHYNEHKIIYGSKINPEYQNRYNNETPIEWVIRHFKEKGYGNNHAYINVGNVDSGFNYDIPFKEDTERRTSPCFRGIDFKIKNGCLITSVIFRSWDLYAGFPENMGGIALLNEYVANELEIKPGPLAFTSAGLHCYSYQLDPLTKILHKNEI